MEYSYYKEYTLNNGKTLAVRTLVPHDAKRMIDLITTADTQTRFLSREPGEFGYTEEAERELIAQRDADENVLWIVGEIDGKLVANCEARRLSGRARFRHRASMGIVVLRDYWRLGIGKILIQELIRWCGERGFEQLELDVVANNAAAIALYQSVGFEICGTKKNALKYPDGTYCDEHYMIKPLI